MPRKRLSLDLASWPEPEQLAWARAIERRPLFGGRALAAGWAPATRARSVQAYGQWLHFLARQGWLDPGEALCARITEQRLAAYIAELGARLKPISVASQLRDLGEALRVMDPDGNRALVLDAAAYALANAAPSRDDREKIVGPSEFHDAALERMRRFSSELGSTMQATMGFQGGLMMGVAISKPARLRNLAGLLIGTNLLQHQDGSYELKLREGKTRKAAEAEAILPPSLSEFLDAWLGRGRPFLLRGRSSPALWLMPDGSDMTAPAFYYYFGRATCEELGRPINPHAVRKIVATGIAVSEPGHVELIQHILDHESDDMRKQWYDLADRLAASLRYIDLLAARRKRAIDRIDEEDGG